MYCYSLGREIINLFSGMSAVSVALFSLGLMLVVTEYFQSTKGIAYGCGIASMITAAAVRMVMGGTLGTLFVMLFFIALILFATHLLMLALHKREWLLLSSGIADEESYDDDKYSYLVGLCGTTTTELSPSGHMSINEINFYVTAEEPIEAGAYVTVKQVCGDKIVVERVQYED